MKYVETVNNMKKITFLLVNLFKMLNRNKTPCIAEKLSYRQKNYFDTNRNS